MVCPSWVLLIVNRLENYTMNVGFQVAHKSSSVIMPHSYWLCLETIALTQKSVFQLAIYSRWRRSRSGRRGKVKREQVWWSSLALAPCKSVWYEKISRDLDIFWWNYVDGEPSWMNMTPSTCSSIRESSQQYEIGKGSWKSHGLSLTRPFRHKQSVCQKFSTAQQHKGGGG
jgi:hypothetical protein